MHTTLHIQLWNNVQAIDLTCGFDPKVECLFRGLAFVEEVGFDIDPEMTANTTDLS